MMPGHSRGPKLERQVSALTVNFLDIDVYIKYKIFANKKKSGYRGKGSPPQSFSGGKSPP